MSRYQTAREVFYEWLDTRSVLGNVFFWTWIQNAYDRWLDQQEDK